MKGTRLMGVRDDREILYECLNIFSDLNHVDILLFQPIKYKLFSPGHLDILYRVGFSRHVVYYFVNNGIVIIFVVYINFGSSSPLDELYRSIFARLVCGKGSVLFKFSNLSWTDTLVNCSKNK